MCGCYARSTLTLITSLPHYLKKVFQHTRELLPVGSSRQPKRLPELLTASELVALYETIWQPCQLTHLAMLKLLLFTGIRNTGLVRPSLSDVDLQTCQARIAQGKGQQDRSILFPMSFRGELAQYMARQQAQGERYLFESNRHRP